MAEGECRLPMTLRLKEELKEMCDLSKGIRRRGVEEGIALSLKNLMKTMHLTLEEAMEALQVPPAERPKFAKML